MELKVCIRTPKGKADVTLDDWKLRVIVNTLFKKANIKERYTNKAKDKMYWLIECNAKQYIKMVKAISMYSYMVAGVFNSKAVNKGIKRLADSPQDYEQLRRMIEDGTHIEVIKEATVQELVETDKTMWQKMKEIFVKT